MVVVNFYPFEQTVARPGVTLDEAIENIDIGGPTLVRAAAKNHADVVVVVDPADYTAIILELDESDGFISAETRWKLARKAFARVTAYDCAISNYLGSYAGGSVRSAIPSARRCRARRCPLAKIPIRPARSTATSRIAEQLHGKELSFNVFDISSAINLMVEFGDYQTPSPSEHNTPCGVVGPTLVRGDKAFVITRFALRRNYHQQCPGTEFARAVDELSPRFDRTGLSGRGHRISAQRSA